MYFSLNNQRIKKNKKKLIKSIINKLNELETI